LCGSGARKEKLMSKEERRMQIELEYVERFERGEAPSLEELVKTYPDMSEELIEFVLNYVSMESDDGAEEPSEEALRAAAAAREGVLEKILAEPESLVEARRARGEKLETLAAALNLPKGVLRALEKDAIMIESVPAKVFARLGRALGLVPERIRDLIEGAREPIAVHNRAQGAPKGKIRRITFEKALRESSDLNEEHVRDWLSDNSKERER
jgi:hypothetical protein